MLEDQGPRKVLRVGVCGSRWWGDDPLQKKAVIDLVDDLPCGTVVVHGAARGADTAVGNAVRKRVALFYADGLREERHPAEWGKYGKAAGPRRNGEMARSGLGHLYAFRLPGHSPGTDDMIRQSLDAGVPVTLFRAVVNAAGKTLEVTREDLEPGVSLSWAGPSRGPSTDYEPPF